MSYISNNWIVSGECSTPSNTTAAYASFSVPHYPVNGSSNSLPTYRNAIFPMLGQSGTNFLQPILACGTGWNGVSGIAGGNWFVAGYYFNPGGTSAWSSPVGVTPVSLGLQGYITKSGNDWLCGMNKFGTYPITELTLSNPGLTMYNFGVVIEWRGYTDAAGTQYTTSSDCRDLIADAVNFTQIGIEAGGTFPSVSYITNTYSATDCGTTSATVNSSSNPNGSITLRPQ